MPRRSRAEIRWASLRAAAKVALFAGSMACGAEATTLSQQADAGETQSADAAVVVHPDAAARGPDAATTPDAAAADMGSEDVGFFDVGFADAGSVDAGPVDTGLADAGGPTTICGFFPETQEEIEAWSECCNENWEDPGCQVWGPPAPPSMEIA